MHACMHAQIVLRNAGGQTANLTGWRLTDSDTRTGGAALLLLMVMVMAMVWAARSMPLILETVCSRRWRARP